MNPNCCPTEPADLRNESAHLKKARYFFPAVRREDRGQAQQAMYVKCRNWRAAGECLETVFAEEGGNSTMDPKKAAEMSKLVRQAGKLFAGSHSGVADVNDAGALVPWFGFQNPIHVPADAAHADNETTRPVPLSHVRNLQV